ncbi:hypothetical protein BgiBS90_010724 [Biomphalaria glabrata]|nr:hypothetical protein BgiBS90_010724 [Biomphalaria glabrata]
MLVTIPDNSSSWLSREHPMWVRAWLRQDSRRHTRSEYDDLLLALRPIHPFVFNVLFRPIAVLLCQERMAINPVRCFTNSPKGTRPKYCTAGYGVEIFFGPLLFPFRDEKSEGGINLNPGVRCKGYFRPQQLFLFGQE